MRDGAVGVDLYNAQVAGGVSVTLRLGSSDADHVPCVIAPMACPSTSGNAAAMRKALNEIQLVCYKAGITIGYDVACGIIKSKSRAALSAPPRNCDVGTAEEQLNRFIAFCLSRKCNECPFVSSTYGECGVRWSQMPYEEGGAE